MAKARLAYEVRRRTPWILLSVAAGVAMIWVGLVLGLVGGIPMGLFAYAWFHDAGLALGTDEITTALSDNLSILICLMIATAILFGA